MKKINRKHEEQLINDAINEFIKISTSNLVEVIEKLDKKIDNLNQPNTFKNILINFTGNALFKVIRKDKGINAYVKTTEQFMEHLAAWFNDALEIKENELSDDCPHYAEAE